MHVPHQTDQERRKSNSHICKVYYIHYTHVYS